MASSPSELSLEEIRKFLLDKGGSARNQDLVKHFKKFLTDPESRVEARNRFKEYINTLATIKSEENEKYLVLKRKFRQPTLDLSSPTLSYTERFPTSPLSTPDLSTPTSSYPERFPISPLSTPDLLTPTSPLREPPPYRPPPIAPISPIVNTSSPVRRFPFEPVIGIPQQPIGLPQPYGPPKPLGRPQSIGIPVAGSIVEENVCVTPTRPVRVEGETRSPVTSPPVPPRRKSQDKIKLINKENQNADRGRNGPEPTKQEPPPPSPNQLTPAEQLSVRERMQRFNRMATETDMPATRSPNAASTPPAKKRSDKGAEEDDRASVASQLDGKSREWLVKAAQGDYQALAKLAAEEPRLARIKDPSSGYTALHWAAKHGDENIVKLVAGTCKDYIKSVNETSNGGYTALHIALQFDHENIYNLLVKVYGANQDIRDYSGKKARQYLVSQKAAVSQDTMRKIKARKKHTERDLGFLRIGSLNVRVKRTTEAFSQFLGVATNPSSNSSEKIHKSWGSADNLPGENKLMPPPKYAPIKKRRSRRASDFSTGSRPVSSQPRSPRSPRSLPQRRPASVSALSTNNLLVQAMAPPKESQNDSDSDGACGFDAAWRGSA